MSVPAPSAVRRRAGAVSLVAGGVCAALMAALQPVGSDGTSAQYVQSVLAHPTQTTVASVFDMLGSVLVVPGIVAVWGYLRGRGRVLGTIGMLLGASGAVATTFGMGGQQVALRVAQIDPKVAVTLNDALGDLPTFSIFVVFIYLGLIGSVLLAIGAVRGGLVRWWVPVIQVVGLALNVVLDQNLYGLPAAALFLLPLVAEVLLAVGLFRSGTAVSPTTNAEAAATVASPGPARV